MPERMDHREWGVPQKYMMGEGKALVPIREERIYGKINSHSCSDLSHACKCIKILYACIYKTYA